MKHKTLSSLHVRGVVFDLDGVLVDSESYNKWCEQEVCKRNGLCVPESTWHNLKGMTNREVFRQLLVAASAPATNLSMIALAAEKQSLFIQNIQRIKPIPGAMEFVHRCLDRFSLVGLATSSSARVQQAVCAAFGLSSAFRAVVTGDDIVGRGKPDPEPYLLAADRLGAAPKELFAVEDSTNGVISAVRAGYFVVAITTSYPSQDLVAAGAHDVVDSFEELEHQL